MSLNEQTEQFMSPEEKLTRLDEAFLEVDQKPEYAPVLEGNNRYKKSELASTYRAELLEALNAVAFTKEDFKWCVENDKVGSTIKDVMYVAEGIVGFDAEVVDIILSKSKGYNLIPIIELVEQITDGHVSKGYLYEELLRQSSQHNTVNTFEILADTHNDLEKDYDSFIEDSIHRGNYALALPCTIGRGYSQELIEEAVTKCIENHQMYTLIQNYEWFRNESVERRLIFAAMDHPSTCESFIAANAYKFDPNNIQNFVQKLESDNDYIAVLDFLPYPYVDLDKQMCFESAFYDDYAAPSVARLLPYLTEVDTTSLIHPMVEQGWGNMLMSYIDKIPALTAEQNRYLCENVSTYYFYLENVGGFYKDPYVVGKLSKMTPEQKEQILGLFLRYDKYEALQKYLEILPEDVLYDGKLNPLLNEFAENGLEKLKQEVLAKNYKQASYLLGILQKLRVDIDPSEIEEISRLAEVETTESSEDDILYRTNVPKETLNFYINEYILSSMNSLDYRLQHQGATETGTGLYIQEQEFKDLKIEGSYKELRDYVDSECAQVITDYFLKIRLIIGNAVGTELKNQYEYVEGSKDVFFIQPFDNIQEGHSTEDIRVILRRAQQFYKDTKWYHSYGGSAWDKIAELGAEAWNVDMNDIKKQCYINDKACDIQHNTGHIVDKDSRLEFISALQNVLDAKRNMDITELLEYGLKNEFLSEEEFDKYNALVEKIAELSVAETRVKGTA